MLYKQNVNINKQFLHVKLYVQIQRSLKNNKVAESGGENNTKFCKLIDNR